MFLVGVHESPLNPKPQIQKPAVPSLGSWIENPKPKVFGDLGSGWVAYFSCQTAALDETPCIADG